LRRTPLSRLAKITGVMLFAGILTGCSTSTSTPSNPGNGTLITIVHDVPLCNAISANVVIENLSFTPVGSTNTVGYITTTPSFAPEIRLNLEQLRDFDTILYEFPVQAGTYTQANLDFELAQLAAYDPTLNPPVRTLTASLTNSKPIVYITPPLVINANQTNVMVLDFDVLRMLATDASHNLTGQMTPVANITQLSNLTPTGSLNPNGFIELDDLWGFVRMVTNSNSTSNPNYIGNFQMQLLSPSTADAPEVPMNLTATTNKVGFADLVHLLPNSYVEVDAILDSQGNLAAKQIEVQAVEDPFPATGVTPSTALIGPIVYIKTDPAGNPTQLGLWVHDAEPADISTLLFDNIYLVDLTANPTYQASALGPNFANLSFGPQNLAVGQELVVHGAYIKPPAPAGGGVSTQPFNVEPTAIYLKLQSMQGTMVSMLTIGSDDATGVFTLSPCCSLLQGVPIYVVTNNQTNYVNVTGLGGINTVSSLLVKGMPYYEPKAMSVNGVTIPAGSMVFQAKQVHVLE
jgi:hypothetical protein